MLRILVPLMGVKYFFFRFNQHLFCIYLEGMSELTVSGDEQDSLNLQVFFRQNPRSLVYFEFCAYLLWVQAIKANSLVV